MTKKIAAFLFLNLFFLAAHNQSLAQGAPKSRGNSFNPDIGVNGLFTYRHGSHGNEATSNPRNGFEVQEIEMQFASDVDPYLRAVGFFSVKQDPATGEWEFEPEEVYAETIGLSLIRAQFGKIDALVNKHSLLHRHAFPFIDAPLINLELMGDEGLREPGISVSALIPTNWFMELTLQLLGGEHEDLFDSASPNDHVGVGYLDTLFDLRDDLTLQLGASVTHGQNMNGASTNLYGGELAMKWKPIGRDRIRTLKWATQYLDGMIFDSADATRKRGVSSYLQWQFAQRWWAQVRAESSDESLGQNLISNKTKNSALLAFTPSEFSAVRVQYDQMEGFQPETERRVTMQLNWSIGAHPAHNY